MTLMDEWDETLPERAREALASATTAQIEGALKHATEFLDTLPFKGTRARPNQNLSWPRTGVVSKGGSPILGVPVEIKDATSLVAGFILAKIPFDTPALAWVMLKIGHLLEDDADIGSTHVTWH